MAGNKWQISDELWEKMARLILERKIHPHCVRIASALIIVRHECHFLYVQKDCQWNALNATGFVRPTPLTGAFRNGGMPEYLNASGRTACLPVNIWMLLTGRGCRSMDV